MAYKSISRRASVDGSHVDGIGENTTPSAIADMSTTSAAAVAAVIFLERDKGPPAQPEVLLIHMYRTTMHTMDTAITMMVAGAQ